MRIAALYDIHGNLPALDAVLSEVELIGPDAIVIGGDVAIGGLPSETIERLRDLDERAHFVMGNADRELVEAFDEGRRVDETDEEFERLTAWGASRLDRVQRDFLASFRPVVSLEADALGPALFCHGSPRSDTEMITALTPPERLEAMLAGVAEPIVVCGHTHHQFELAVAGRRVVNAGAVGMPYQGAAAAFWLLLGPDVVLRRTDYDVGAALDTMRAAGAPGIDEAMRESLVDPIAAETVARFFEARA
ncbi:MAG TPA: metallophosphoesterase family protein [Solirubrobacteraceae bacterium]|nr:metallophosphoesterase family protein [Solirubrobacteraceae bacterium]